MRESLYDYCTRTRRQALLEEWDVEGNGALTPLALSHGRPPEGLVALRAGHRWQAAVYTRTGAESGCPYSAGEAAWPGFNDLASQEPALAASGTRRGTARSPRTRWSVGAPGGCGGSAAVGTSGPRR